jgi:hypothetical protein
MRQVALMSLLLGGWAAGATAAPGFAFGSAGYDMLPGSTILIPVLCTGNGAIGSMELFLETDVPIEITSVRTGPPLWPDDPVHVMASQVGVFGAIWPWPEPNPIIDPQHALAFMTLYQPIVVAPGSVLATVGIHAPVASAGSTAGLRTRWTVPDRIASSFDGAEADPQGWALIRVVPEPASLVLVGWAGLWPAARRGRRCGRS